MFLRTFDFLNYLHLNIPSLKKHEVGGSGRGWRIATHMIKMHWIKFSKNILKKKYHISCIPNNIPYSFLNIPTEDYIFSTMDILKPFLIIVSYNYKSMKKKENSLIKDIFFFQAW